MITAKNEGCLDKFKVQPAVVLDSVTKEPCAKSKRQRTLHRKHFQYNNEKLEEFVLFWDSRSVTEYERECVYTPYENYTENANLKKIRCLVLPFLL